MTGSLAFRKNEAAIRRGDAPGKYTRILPHVRGERILEFGSAEGVLALLLSCLGKFVTALEANEDRHRAAISLRDDWLRDGLLPPEARMEHVLGRAEDALGHVAPGVFDTLVAVRMIYYLRHDIDAVFRAVSKLIPNVVLCGNKNRAAEWRQGIPDKDGGPLNYYASAEGMKALLMRHGYTIVEEDSDGDPIVVGRKKIA